MILVAEIIDFLTCKNYTYMYIETAGCNAIKMKPLRLFQCV